MFAFSVLVILMEAEWVVGKQFYILALNSNCINEYINEQIKLLDTLDYILGINTFSLISHFLV